MLQKVFTILLSLQFLMNGFHDWVDIPGWTHGRQVRAAVGVNKMVIGTVVNCSLPGLAAALAIYYWHAHVPMDVRNFWLIYCVAVVAGAIAMWWIPYFRGADQKTKDLYSEMCGGTIQVLRPRGDNPRPNLFHLGLHASGATNLILAGVIWLYV
jgi:hypothetical protein